MRTIVMLDEQGGKRLSHRDTVHQPPMWNELKADLSRPFINVEQTTSTTTTERNTNHSSKTTSFSYTKDNSAKIKMKKPWIFLIKKLNRHRQIEIENLKKSPLKMTPKLNYSHTHLQKGEERVILSVNDLHFENRGWVQHCKLS